MILVFLATHELAYFLVCKMGILSGILKGRFLGKNEPHSLESGE